MMRVVFPLPGADLEPMLARPGALFMYSIASYNNESMHVYSGQDDEDTYSLRFIEKIEL